MIPNTESVLLLLLGHSYVNDKLAKSIIKMVDLREVNTVTKHLIHHWYN